MRLLVKDLKSQQGQSDTGGCGMRNGPWGSDPGWGSPNSRVTGGEGTLPAQVANELTAQLCDLQEKKKK